MFSISRCVLSELNVNKDMRMYCFCEGLDVKCKVSMELFQVEIDNRFNVNKQAQTVRHGGAKLCGAVSATFEDR